MRRKPAVSSNSDRLTAQEVATRLGVSRATIWRWQARGSLPASVVFVTGGPYRPHFQLVPDALHTAVNDPRFAAVNDRESAVNDRAPTAVNDRTLTEEAPCSPV